LLHLAVAYGNIPVVKYLMSQPYAADIALPDYLGNSLLHYATASHSTPLLIDFLIEYKGFDLMARNKCGRTLLHHATMHKNLDAIKHLFKLGIAQPDVLDQDGRTAFQLALSCRSTYVVKYLQEYYDIDAVEQLEKADQGYIAIGVLSTKKDIRSLSLAKAMILALLLSFLCWYTLQMDPSSRLATGTGKHGGGTRCVEK
jgi:ankyrin repeat protein